MSDYIISQVYASDKRTYAQIDALLDKEGIKRDGNLDYTCAMYDDNYHVIGTGSCFGNTLRCFAVSSDHQGEGLLNEIISHLIDYQYSRGNLHLFLYTKIQSAKFFRDLGFYEIAHVDNTLVFMENRRNGFSEYLKRLQQETSEQVPGCQEVIRNSVLNRHSAIIRNSAPGQPPETGLKIGAIVMNANPFTLGHQYLVEEAASECDFMHLFVISEDASLVPFAVRRKLVIDGTSHLSNIILHDSGPYIISSATFPSYFLKDEAAVIEGHARLDLAIFSRISQALGITARYVGEEPTSQVTGIYNHIMSAELPEDGIECRIIPRKEACGKAISASAVRRAIQQKDMESLRLLLPESTYRYFTSPEAAPVIEKIRKAGDIIHY